MKTQKNIGVKAETIPGSEGERSDPKLTGIDATSKQTFMKVSGLKFPPPDPEVDEKPKRRRFTAEYKIRILREAEQCKEWGELGALLRREGLYYSNLQTWRRARERAEREALSENKRLKEELKKPNFIIEVKKKISDLLGIDQPQMDRDKIDG